MEPVVKRLIALVVLNIVLLAIVLSKNKDKGPVSEPVVTEQVTAPYLSSANEKQHPGKSQSNAAKPQSPSSTGSKASTTTSSTRTTTSTTTKPKAVPEQRRTLSNGSQPYAAWYGYNQRYSSNDPQSTIQVTSAVSQDVIVIVKYNNQDGRVAGHLYIQAGRTGKIYVTPGYRYQVFFYYGDDWDENKQMPGGVRGGFTRHEQADKDPNSHYFAINETYDGITWDGGMEYNLNPTYSGNFNTKKSSVSEVF